MIKNQWSPWMNPNPSVRLFMVVLVMFGLTLRPTDLKAVTPIMLWQQESTGAPPSTDRQPAPKERVAAIKKSFAESQARLRHFQWIETTAVSLKGDEKANNQKQCYYGADGKIQKIAINPPEEDKPGHGIRGRVKEKKKAELTGYLKDAAALVHEYIPPDPEKLQKAVEAGKATIRVIDPGKRAAIEFADYHKPGDALSIEIDLATNSLLGVTVTSWLEDAKDIVKLNVKFDKLQDGTIYTSETVLDGESQHVKVAVTNSGYREVK